MFLIHLTSGERVRYDRLLLAMGAAPAPLDLPGRDLNGVFSLRTLTDAQDIRQWMLPRRTALVIGEGIVSIQLAESLARMGKEVHYSLLGEHVWPDALDPAASRIVEGRLRDLGVHVHKRVNVARIVGRDGAVSAAELDRGTVIPCEMLGHGCSFRPNTDILAGGPVACADGVVVNERLETGVAGIYAAGSVISLGPGAERAIPHGQLWRNAFTLGETAALNMLDREVSVEDFAASVRTSIAGVSLAVIGRGNLGDMEPGVHVDKTRPEPTYRRLVFRDDMLVGAILVGDVAHAAILEQHVQSRTLRADLEGTLLPALMADEPRLTRILDGPCPICTDRLTLPPGTLIGIHFTCRSCSARLRLTYSAGRLAIVPAEE